MHFPTTPPGLLTSLRFLQLELSLLLLSLFWVVLIIVAVAVLVALVLIVVLVSHRVLSRVIGGISRGAAHEVDPAQFMMTQCLPLPSQRNELVLDGRIYS